MLSLGWNPEFQKSFEETDVSDFLVARVMGQGRGHYHLQIAPETTLEAAITAKLHDSIKESLGFPTVGDWVTYKIGVGNQQATIHRVLSRKSVLARRRAGGPQTLQLISANVDQMCVVTSCNEDFDLPRLGRYLAMTKDSSIKPIILLTKTDLAERPQDFVDKLNAEFAYVQTYLLSSLKPDSIEQLKVLFEPGMTTVLLGSSGVGKSTLTNQLLGFSSQKTQSVSHESRGRHTTTSRNLRFTQWGGIVIDTPGMQEIADEPRSEIDLQKEFADLEELTLQCKFTNCLHAKEPGCAVQNALNSGGLTLLRWDAYLNRAKVATRAKPKRRG